MITGRPLASSASALSPRGQARAHAPHLISRNAIHRSGRSSSSAIRYPTQRFLGGMRASVGQTTAHFISSQATHGCTIGSMTGVPAASPAPGGALKIACAGHTSRQSPHRVHAAMKATSARAPGGRKYRCGTTLRSVRSATSSTSRPNVARKNCRRSPSPLMSFVEPRLRAIRTQADRHRKQTQDQANPSFSLLR